MLSWVWNEISMKFRSRNVVPVFSGFYMVDPRKYSASNKGDESLLRFLAIRIDVAFQNGAVVCVGVRDSAGS